MDEHLKIVVDLYNRVEIMAYDERPTGLTWAAHTTQQNAVSTNLGSILHAVSNIFSFVASRSETVQSSVHGIQSLNCVS